MSNDRVNMGAWWVSGFGADTQAEHTVGMGSAFIDERGCVSVAGSMPPAVMIEVLRRMGALDRPGLPAEPAAGMVRCRVPVLVGDDGPRDWYVPEIDGMSDAQFVEDGMEPKMGDRLSWVTFDAPKPEPATEIVGVEVDHG